MASVTETPAQVDAEYPLATHNDSWTDEAVRQELLAALAKQIASWTVIPRQDEAMWPLAMQILSCSVSELVLWADTNSENIEQIKSANINFIDHP